MAAFSFRQAGRITVGALSFVALGACAQGTNLTELDPLVEGMAGTTATGGTDAGSAGMPTAGDTSGMPMAGTPASGGTTVGSGGSVTTAGSGGAAGSGGSGGMPGGGGGGGGMGGSSAGMAGMAGMAGSSGSGGAPATGHRYAKLVGTSEQNGKVWSSVAELQIMTTGNVLLNRSAWTVTADSEETEDQVAPATAAIDGDNATFWHTAWAPAPDDVNDAKLPHSLIVDLKTTQPIIGFSYLPRQSGANGRIKDWQFFISKDGTNWGTAVKTGSFPNVATLQNVSF